MSNAHNFTGCKAFIYGENRDKALAHTTVLTYDPSWVVITIDGTFLQLKENAKVTVLLLHHNALTEFQGMIRKMDNIGRQEIALFKGHEKEDREATRYTVNLPAQVTGIIIGQKTMPLAPVNITVVNLSSSGILIRSSAFSFNIGTSFQLRMTINQASIMLTAQIARTQAISKSESEYGCILTGRG